MNLIKISDDLWINPEQIIAIQHYDRKVWGDDGRTTGVERKARIFTSVESWSVDPEYVAHLDPDRHPVQNAALMQMESHGSNCECSAGCLPAGY